ATHHRQVEQVVADVGDRLGGQPAPAQDVFDHRELVGAAQPHLVHAQLARPLFDDLAAAARDEPGQAAAAVPVDQPGTVVHVEGLQLAAFAVEVDPPVGQHAVDIGDQHADRAEVGTG